jgi:predicted molibdopterin-dependent oxidoreductase YjgC
VVQDTFLTQTARLADVVLPVAILGERRGRLVSADGVSRELRRVLSPTTPLPQDGEILVELARLLGVELPAGESLDREIGTLVSWPVPVTVEHRLDPVDPPSRRPEMTGMLLDASPQLFHSGSLTSYSSQIRELSPTVAARLSPVDADRLGVRNGEMLRITADERELLLRARLDRTVRPGTIVILWHGSGDSAASLVDEIDEPIEVEVRRSQ